MTTHHRTTTIIRSEAEFLALRDEWHALFAAAASPHPVLRHAWQSHAWREARRRLEHPLAVLVRDNGRLQMAATFTLGVDRFRPVIRFLKGSLPQLDEVLYRHGPHTTDHAVALLSALRRHLVLPRVLRHGRFAETSPLVPAVARLGLPVTPRRRWPRFFLDTAPHGDFAAYRWSLGKQLRNDHQRRLRRLEETGSFAFRRLHGEAARPVLAWLLDTKRRWARVENQSARWLTSRAVDRFLDGRLFAADAPPWSLWSLEHAGRPFAALLSFEEATTWHFQMIAHDPAYRQYAPGRTLNLLAIEQAFEAGIERIGFGVTGEEWKARLLDGRDTTLGMKVHLK